MLVGKTKHQTQADRTRLATFADIGCLPCMIDGWDGVLATVQHETDGGRRMDDEHQHTYPACPWHHLGDVPSPAKGSVTTATRMYGPSFAHSRSAYAARYGSENVLVSIASVLVEAHQSAMSKGCFMGETDFGQLARSQSRQLSGETEPDRPEHDETAHPWASG